MKLPRSFYLAANPEKSTCRPCIKSSTWILMYWGKVLTCPPYVLNFEFVCKRMSSDSGSINHYLETWKPLHTFLVLHKRGNDWLLLKSVGDHLGHIAAWISQIPIIFSFAVGGLVVMRRDLHTVSNILPGLISLDFLCNWNDPQRVVLQDIEKNN